MIYALIPARGGSKSIPQKNIKDVNGKPLIWYVLKAAQESRIDKVFVATDYTTIKEIVQSFGFKKVKVVSRSAESATDKAKTEVVMKEFCTSREFDYLLLLQATSPLITAGDINRSIAVFMSQNYDTLLSVVKQKRFMWRPIDGVWEPTNYNPVNRPMRQDFDGQYVENGCFYMMTRKGFLESGCRLHGRIGAVEYPEYTYFEADDPKDFVVIESLLKVYGDIC